VNKLPLAALALTLASCVTSPPAPPPGTGAEPTGEGTPPGTGLLDPATGWKLVWADEFDVDGPPNPDKWNVLTWGPYRVNQELQAYLPKAENVRVENQRLVITARKVDEDFWKYSSGRITTEGKFSFLYGRVEFRAKLPRGIGTWPALWLMPEDLKGYGKGWPDSGEIDVMEHVGHRPGEVLSTVHTGQYNWPAGTQRGGHIQVDDVFDTWHTYAVEWAPGGLDFFVDDRKVFRFDNDRTDWKAWPYDKPFHLILNVAVGGNLGGQQGVDETAFPASMQIDWVRVYRRQP